MHNRTLDIGQIFIVLQRLTSWYKGTTIIAQRVDAYPLQQTSLFAEVSNSRTVVVGERLIAENGVRDLRCMDEIHFKEAYL